MGTLGTGDKNEEGVSWLAYAGLGIGLLNHFPPESMEWEFFGIEIYLSA